jgi:pimeloyl-ACP methyl ester carboxylesterase
VKSIELSVNGFTFSGLQSGPSAGRPVLLLHGFPQTSWSWRHQLEALENAGHRGLAFDQRGYSSGARPPDVSDYRVEELVVDALSVADSQGWEAFDVVGHDWGAVVAWALAGIHPDRIKTLTAVSVPHPAAFASALGSGDGDQASRSSYIEVFRAEGGVAEKILLGEDGSGDGLRSMFTASGFPEGHEDVEVFVKAMLEPGALTAALNWYRAMSAGSFAQLGKITVPTLYVWSTKDIALGRRGAEDTVNWVSGPYRFEILKGVSHWIPEMAPDDMSRLLLEHLGAHA